MENHEKRGDEIVYGDEDRRKPAYGIAADCPDISVKSVENIPIRILIQGKPVCIDDLVKNIRLNVVVDIDAELCGNPVYNTAKQQTKSGTSHHDQNHDPKLAHLMTGNDIDHVFAGHTADKPHGCAEDSEKGIKCNGPLVSRTVAENPLPVVYNL